MISLPPELIQRAWDFAIAFDAKVKRGEKGGKGTHGINDGPWRVFEGKCAEFIFALERGLDPSVVDCEVYDGKVDPGFDVVENRIKVAVKQTQASYQYLFWPQGKNDDFEDGDFHVIVLVKTTAVYEKGVPVKFSGESYGWLEKRAFAFRKKIAPDGLKPEELHHLTPGTWYVRQERLHPMHEFEPGKRPHIRAGERLQGPREHYCPECCAAASFGFTVGGDTTFFCTVHRPQPCPSPMSNSPSLPTQGRLF